MFIVALGHIILSGVISASIQYNVQRKYSIRKIICVN